MEYWAKRLALCLCACVGLCVALGGCQKRQVRQVQGFAMDTLITLTVYGEADEAAARACLPALANWERDFAAQQPDGQLGALNAAGSGTLAGETAALFVQAMHWANETQGAFDPALGQLIALWHVQTREADEPLPTQAEIDVARAASGTAHVRWQQGDGVVAVQLSGGAQLDLGGIAKGYAADLCAQLLAQHGVTEAIVNLGGNVRIVGQQAHTVGVQDPRDAQRILLQLDAADESVVTSGDYQRYAEVGGQRIHHVLDARTGKSADSGLVSATVVGRDGAACDALSTAVLVLGAEEGMALLKRTGYEGILVTQERQVLATDGLKGRVKLLSDAYTMP